MKYLCLICIDEKKLEAMSKTELDAIIAEHFAFDESLRQSGHLIVTEALQPVKNATTVRVRNGRASASDGPFAETKEQIGGFYLLQARDLNEAIRIASRIPSGRHGCVEVRPIWDLTLPQT